MSAEAFTASIDIIHPSVTGKAAAVQALVERFFGLLDAAGIPYCLLRNRDRIPFGMLSWSDLDVLVPADAPTSRLVEVLADLSPSQIVDVRPGLVIFSFPVEDLFIRVDICYGDVDWRGAPFVSADEVLAQRWNDDGIMVASPLHQAYVTWISKLIWSGFFAERYALLIQRSLHDQPDELHRLLERAFGRTLADTLFALARDGHLRESEALIPQLRRSLWRRALRRHPGRQIRASLGQMTSRTQTLMHPSGLVVAMISPDDLVKSEICSSLSKPAARTMPCGRIDRLVGDRRVLPSLDRLRAKPADQMDPSQRSGQLPAWVMAYDAIDHSLNHWKSTRYRLTRGRLVIDEREKVPELLGIGQSTPAMSRLLRRLAPQPDLIVVLDTAVQSSSKDMEARRAAFCSFAVSHPNAHLVNADQPLERVVSDVKALIVASYEERTSRRYPRLSR